MKDDHLNQEINEDQRGRPIISSYPIPRGRSTSGWRRSEVNKKRRSRSLVLFRSPRLGVVITLSTEDTAPTVPSENDAATHFPPSTSITRFPEYSHLETATVAAGHLVTQAPLPPDELFSEEPCATQRTTSVDDEHREQAPQDSPAPTNQAACPPSRGTPALKKPKTNGLRILKKVLVALWKRKLNLPPREPPSPPIHPPSPMTAHRTTESEQDVDLNSCYHTALSSPVSTSRSQIAEDDDNTSFVTAMSGEPEDLLEPLSEIDSSDLVPDVDDRELARSDAYTPNILLSIPTPLPSHDLCSDSPEGHSRQRHMVNMRGNDVEEEAGGVSPSTSGSDSMPPSPQSVSQVDCAKMAHSPIVTIDRDISIDHLPDGNGDIGSYIPKMQSHQSLLFQTRLDRKTGEDTTNEQTIKVDKPHEDVRLAPLSAGGALDCIYWEAGFRRESTYYDTQGGHLGLAKEDTEQGVAVACSSPSVAIQPELVPLPCDEEDLDLDLATAGETYSITQDQVIVSAESRTGGQASDSPALNVDSEPEQHPLPEIPSDPPCSSRDTQDASIAVFRERVALEVMHPHSTDILPASGKHLDRMQEKHTTDPVVSESSLETDARGGLGSEPQPSEKQPLGGATPGAGAQGRTRSLVENINQVGAQSTTSATDVQGSTIDEAEVILQLLQMAARLVVPNKKANSRNDTFDEGDLDRLFQSQSPSLVFNYTNNNIHNVTHGPAGDHFYGPIGQSSVAGHGSRNIISNQK